MGSLLHTHWLSPLELLQGTCSPFHRRNRGNALMRAPSRGEGEGARLPAYAPPLSTFFALLISLVATENRKTSSPGLLTIQTNEKKKPQLP